jgi:hypothetical protein
MSQPRPNSKQDKTKVVPTKNEEEEAKALELKKAVRFNGCDSAFAIATLFPTSIHRK